MKLSIMFILANMLVAASGIQDAVASSEAGLDVSLRSVRVRVVYSEAVDYDKKAGACIRDPSCLLFDLIGYLQQNAPSLPPRQEVLQFELYQSAKKNGDHLALVRDPYEGGRYQKLFDGRAESDLTHQIVALLGVHLKIQNAVPRQPSVVKLYRCQNRADCGEILFGAFPSEGMRAGYCVYPGKGCETTPISVKRSEMSELFTPIEE